MRPFALLYCRKFGQNLQNSQKFVNIYLSPKGIKYFLPVLNLKKLPINFEEI